METIWTSPPIARRRMAGVTLIELMIVVVVVAVLAAIAVPNYRQYTLRSQRTEAKSALLQLAANQERYYTQNGNSFTDDLGELNMSATTEGGRYTLSVALGVNAALDYTATATAAGTMTTDTNCQTFTINAQGVRTSGPQADCW